MNLNLGIGALDIPIARKLDISDASERSLQAPVRPAQAPGRARPGPGPARPAAWAGQPRQPGGPSRLRSGPSERCISPPWTGGRMERRRSRWNDESPDGALAVRMERWLSRWDDGIIIGPRQARRPARLPIRPSGPAQRRGQPTRSFRAASGASKPNFDA